MLSFAVRIGLDCGGARDFETKPHQLPYFIGSPFILRRRPFITSKINQRHELLPQKARDEARDRNMPKASARKRQAQRRPAEPSAPLFPTGLGHIRFRLEKRMCNISAPILWRDPFAKEWLPDVAPSAIRRPPSAIAASSTLPSSVALRQRVPSPSQTHRLEISPLPFIYIINLKKRRAASCGVPSQTTWTYVGGLPAGNSFVAVASTRTASCEIDISLSNTTNWCTCS